MSLALGSSMAEPGVFPLFSPAIRRIIISYILIILLQLAFFLRRNAGMKNLVMSVFALSVMALGLCLSHGRITEDDLFDDVAAN